MNKSFNPLVMQIYESKSSLMQIFSSNINYSRDCIAPYKDPEKENKVALKVD